MSQREDRQIMNEYEKLAIEIQNKLINNNGTVEVTPEEAMKIINCLLGMSRIKKITESKYGGAELF
jgi:hypothetical protein